MPDNDPIKMAQFNSHQRVIQRAQRIAKEIEIMEDLGAHPHIVRLRSVWRCLDKRQLVMVLEYAPYGELFDYVQKRKRLGEAEARNIMWQLMDALACIHARGYVHRDLKLENILLGEGMRVLVSDFGFATRSHPVKDVPSGVNDNPTRAPGRRHPTR